jgi:hypothetical protein
LSCHICVLPSTGFELVSQVTLRSSGTDLVYGCHLLRCLYILLCFLWLYNDFFIILCNILKIPDLDCCQIIKLSIYVPSTRARHISYVYLLIFLSRQGNTSIIEAPFVWSGCGRVVKGAEHNAKWFILQCINGVSSNPVDMGLSACRWSYILNIIIWQQSKSAIFYILNTIMKKSLYSHRKQSRLYKHLSKWQPYTISVPLDYAYL